MDSGFIKAGNVARGQSVGYVARAAEPFRITLHAPEDVKGGSPQIQTGGQAPRN